MKAKWAKKKHRYLNKCVRAANLALYNDPLWLGRFYVEEKKIYFIDNENEILYIIYEMVDKKTGIRKRTMVFSNTFWSFWQKINDFIVHTVKVWDENPPPSIYNPQDFREI